jgi:predicted Kef-type K+ transport protein
MELVFLAAAFGLGFAATLVRLPPMVGYLAAGFALNAFGQESSEALDRIADLGVLLLLFGIGLKLRPRTLVRREVWGTALVFAVAGAAFPAAVLIGASQLGAPLAADIDLQAALTVGFALSFSSTIFAVRALEETDEAGSLAGRIAIGVLILQDIAAVGFLVVAGDADPTWWALALIPGFAALRPLLQWVLNRSGHGEMIVLLGFTLAVGVGAEAFDAVGIKPDLGALVAGLLLAGHPRAVELADRLLAFKDLFLVGFFLSIGLGGTPPAAGWVIALVAVLVLPMRSLTSLVLLTRFRLRPRTALHATLTLSTFSEFGLIVAIAAVGAGWIDEVWVSTLGVAVAVSFVLASIASPARYRLYASWQRRLSHLERSPTIEEDAVIDIGDARVLVFGMGRVGTGAYEELVDRTPGPVVGIDRVEKIVDEHRSAGRSVVRGDALDRDFWERVRVHPDVELMVAAMGSHAANLECVRRIREFLPSARIAAIATFPDEVAQLREAGVQVARNLYEEAGQALADDAVSFVWEEDQAP